MATARIKETYKQTAVAFGKSGLPLRMRSEEDINQLAIIAQESGDKSLLHLFEVLPSLEELKKQKVEVQLNKIMPQRQAPVTTANTTNEKGTNQESTDSKAGTDKKGDGHSESAGH